MPVNIHGKQYATVAERLQSLNDATGGEYSLESEIVKFEDGIVVVKATLAVNGYTYNGHAYEEIGSSQINSTSALENAETSAWGRCLSAYGLAGTEIASADEVAQAIHQQNSGGSNGYSAAKDIPADCISFGKHRGKKWSDVPVDYLQWLVNNDGTKPDTRALAQDELDRKANNQDDGRDYERQVEGSEQSEQEDIPF